MSASSLDTNTVRTRPRSAHCCAEKSTSRSTASLSARRSALSMTSTGVRLLCRHTARDVPMNSSTPACHSSCACSDDAWHALGLHA